MKLKLFKTKQNESANIKDLFIFMVTYQNFKFVYSYNENLYQHN